MDKINRYRQIVKQILTQYASYKPSYGEIEVQTLFDKEQDHYQVVYIGWENKRRVYGCSIHLDIKEEKIWIQQNTTEIDVAKELVELGVVPQDIVVGFHPVYLRALTEYAVS